MLIENSPTVFGRQIEEGALLRRYHTEIIQSYARKPGNKLHTSSFLQESAHYAEAKKSIENKSYGDGLASFSIPTLQNNTGSVNTAAKSHSLFKHSELDADFKPSTEAVKLCKKKTGRTRSVKKRRVKSSSKKRKHHKPHEINHELSQNNCMNVTKIVSKSTDLIPDANLSSHQLHAEQKDTNVFSKQLPPAISPYAKPFKFSRTEKLHFKTMSSTSSNHSKRLPSVTKTKPPTTSTPGSSKVEEISLPHPPLSRISPNASNKPSNIEPKKTPPTKLRPENTFGKHSLEAKNFKKILNENSLKDRLNLIHSYGNDYMTVAKQYEAQKKKETALKDYQDKLAEKAKNEKKKAEQRKKIYALNQLMTKLEDEKFQQFMQTLSIEEIS